MRGPQLYSLFPAPPPLASPPRTTGSGLKLNAGSSGCNYVASFPAHQEPSPPRSANRPLLQVIFPHPTEPSTTRCWTSNCSPLTPRFTP